MLISGLRAPLRGAVPVRAGALVLPPPSSCLRAGLHHSALVRAGTKPAVPPEGAPKRPAKRSSRASGKPAARSAPSTSSDGAGEASGASALSSGAGGAEPGPVQAGGAPRDIKYRHDKGTKQLKLVGQKPPALASRVQRAPKELAGLNTSRPKGLHFGELAPSPAKVQAAPRPAGVPTSSAMRARMAQERRRQEQMAIEARKKKVQSVLAPIRRALAIPFKPVTAVWRFLFGRGRDGDRSILESWTALRSEQRLFVAGGLAFVALIGIWVSDYLQATMPPTESEQRDLQEILANIRSRYDQLAENLGAAGSEAQDDNVSHDAASEVMADTAPRS